MYGLGFTVCIRQEVGLPSYSVVKFEDMLHGNWLDT